jgi:hypothetical protein
MNKLLLIPIVVLLAGCSNFGSTYTRVIEYGGGGVVTPFTGEVGGCSVYESKEKIVAKMVYSGKSCIVEVDKE